MRKLIVTAAIVCAAAISQAATCSWKSGTIHDYTGTTAAKDTVTAYLFTISQSDYNSYIAMSAADLSKAIYEDFDTSSAAATKNSTGTGQANLSDTAVASAQYRAILYVDNVNDGYYMGNVAAYTWSGSGTAAVGDLAATVGGDIGGGSTATAWYHETAPGPVPIPEPTSGLLMLLGVAGLALRRRRA